MSDSGTEVTDGPVVDGSSQANGAPMESSSLAVEGGASLDDDGPRIGLIRAAVRTIRSGTTEIEGVFDRARGPLTKKSLRGLHQRVKELRQTAEAAEDAFRDWTVELTGRPLAEGRVEHDALRASFEAEVAGIQQCMAKVAAEAELRQVKKAKAAAPPTDTEAEESSAEPAGPEPASAVAGTSAGDAKVSAPSAVTNDSIARRQAPHSALASTASAPAGVPPRRSPGWSVEAQVGSHASMANSLQQIASQEEEVRCSSGRRARADKLPMPATSHEPAAIREKLSGMPTTIKYVLCIVVCSLALMIYSHARILVVSAGPPAQPRLPAALAQAPVSAPPSGSMS